VKNTFKLSAVLLSILAIVIMMFPGAATAAAPPTYPTSINGMPVILVETSANNIAMQDGKVTLVLLDNTSTLDSASTIKYKLKDYLINNPLPSNTDLEVYGGPNTTKESILKYQKEHNDFQRKNGVMQLCPIPTGTSTGLSTNEIGSQHGFQVDRNNDPWSNPNLDHQACNIVAPSVVAWAQQDYSYFGDNVMTNYYYFLQSGQVYSTNTNFLVWADDTNVYGNPDLAQPFAMTYTAGLYLLYRARL
jgi:hypothetical protein